MRIAHYHASADPAGRADRAPSGFWAIIPSQGFERGKTRLASVLGPAERRAFSRQAFRAVLKAARLAAGASHIVVVSADSAALGLARRAGAHCLVERRPNLNASVQAAARYAFRHGARGVMVLHADLPQLLEADVRRLARALRTAAPVVLAPDRESSGTNALGLRRSGSFRFRFGADSFARHRSEARRLRLRAIVLRSPGLSFDVDLPGHYEAFRAATQPT